MRAGIEQAISRGLSYAPYCDLIWCETSHPDLAEARRFAGGIHAQFPGMMLAYNCSPSFNWKSKLDRVKRPLGDENNARISLTELRTRHSSLG